MSKKDRLINLNQKRQSTVVGYVHPQHVDASWANSMFALLEYENLNAQRFAPPGGRIAVGSGPRIAVGRNALVEAFLARDGETQWLLMIDTDMDFDPDLLDRMFEVADPNDVPILGALCFSGGVSGTMRPVMYRLFLDDQGELVITYCEDYPEGALVNVDATGAACLLVHRSVLERVGEAWVGKTAYPWFAETEFGLREFGEDVTFCMRAKTAGFPIHVCTAIEVGHRKVQTLDSTLYRQQQAKTQTERDAAERIVVPARKLLVPA